SRRRHTRSLRDWSSDVCSSDLAASSSSKALTGGRLREVKAFDDDDAARQERLVRAVMAGMKLLDGEIVDPDEPDAERNKVFRTRSEERRVGKEWRTKRASES